MEGRASGGWLRPRETLRAPSPPLPPPRPRGPALGCRDPARTAPAATGAAQPDRPGRCETGLRRRPASSIAGACGVGSTAGPPCQALSQPLGRRRNPELAREAPPPPRLSRHRSPRGAGQGAGAADRRLSASCLGRALGARLRRRRWPLTSGRRNPEEEEEEEKRHEGGRGKTLLFFSYSLLGLKGRAGHCASAEKAERDTDPLRAEELGPGGPKGLPACGTPRTLSATGRPSSLGRRRPSCGWTRCRTWSASWSAANST